MKTSEIDKLTKHYDKYFKQTTSVILHPIEGTPHIDAILYSPSKLYPFWKLATIGASEYAMNGKNPLGNRNEYMIFIDPSVDMNDKETASKYYNFLMLTALFPIENKAFISYGHSLEFNDEDNDIVGVYLELPEAINDTGILRCKLSLFKTAICLQVILLDRNAMTTLKEIGNERFSFTYTYPDNGNEAHWLSKM